MCKALWEIYNWKRCVFSKAPYNLVGARLSTRERSEYSHTHFVAPGEAPGRELHSVSICLNKSAICL